MHRHITDDSFQAEYPERYDLYVFAGPDSVSCAAVHRAEGMFVALESWNLPGEVLKSIDSLRGESQLLSLTGYRRVVVCSGFVQVTLVPKPLYDPAATNDQLWFSNREAATGHLLTDELHQVEAVNIYSIPLPLYQTFINWFPNAEFHHTSTALIEYLLAANRNSRDELLVVQVHASYIEIIVTRGRHLMLYNHFQYNSPEELTYYILFVCEQLHLNPEHIPVVLAGDIVESDPAYQLTYKYIRNTGMAIRPETGKYPSSFDSLLPQHHFNLFSQVVCVS